MDVLHLDWTLPGSRTSWTLSGTSYHQSCLEDDGPTGSVTRYRTAVPEGRPADFRLVNGEIRDQKSEHFTSTARKEFLGTFLTHTYTRRILSRTATTVKIRFSLLPRLTDLRSVQHTVVYGIPKPRVERERCRRLATRSKRNSNRPHPRRTHTRVDGDGSRSRGAVCKRCQVSSKRTTGPTRHFPSSKQEI